MPLLPGTPPAGPLTWESTLWALNVAHQLADHQKLGESTAALIEKLIAKQAANARSTAALAQQATDTNKQLMEALEALSQAHEAQEALEAENTQLAQSVIKLTLRVETLEQLVGGSSKYSDVKPKGDDSDDKLTGDDDKPMGNDDKPTGDDNKPTGDDDKLMGDKQNTDYSELQGDDQLTGDGDQLKDGDKPKGDDDEPSALMKKHFLSMKRVYRDVVRFDGVQDDSNSYDDDGDSKGHGNSCKGDGNPYIGDSDQLKDSDKPTGDDDEPSALMKRFLSMRWVNRDIARFDGVQDDGNSYDGDGDSKGHGNSCKEEGDSKGDSKGNGNSCKGD